MPQFFHLHGASAMPSRSCTFAWVPSCLWYAPTFGFLTESHLIVLEDSVSELAHSMSFLILTLQTEIVFP